MRANEIKSCYIGPEISPEQFVPEHFFIFLAKGAIHGYDGSKHTTLRRGQYALVRKNRLARYNKERENGEFEKIVVIFDEVFLKAFQEKHPVVPEVFECQDAFIPITHNPNIPLFIASLVPYYQKSGKIDPAFSDLKREELLLILLKSQPELTGLLFDFGKPEKIDLEAYMNRNFRFNVGIERFAYMTGRSLASFKRDFKTVFQESPNRWLVQRRLQEAYFLLEKKHMKPSEFYLDLGFEDLSHFSHAFKRQFGVSPSQILLPKG